HRAVVRFSQVPRPAEMGVILALLRIQLDRPLEAFHRSGKVATLELHLALLELELRLDSPLPLFELRRSALPASSLEQVLVTAARLRERLVRLRNQAEDLLREPPHRIARVAVAVGVGLLRHFDIR